MGWLITIILIIAAFYFFKWLGKLLLFRWIERKQREFARQFGENGGGYTFKQYSWGGQGQKARNKERKPEGEVRIENVHPSPKRVNRNVGDYVEYEEIEVEYEETSK